MRRSTLFVVALAATFVGGQEPMPAGLRAELEWRGMVPDAQTTSRHQRLLEAERLGSLTDAERDELHELRTDRFNLWTGCAPLSLTVSVSEGNRRVQGAGPLAGLTHESLRNLGELKLRSARLYERESTYPFPALFLRVMVAGEAFGVELRFSKVLRDPYFLLELEPLVGRAVTRDYSSVGMYGSDGPITFSTLSQRILTDSCWSTSA